MSAAAEPQDHFGVDSDDDLPETLRSWNLYTGDEWDEGMDSVPDTDIGESSSPPVSLTFLGSSSPIPNPSPQHLVLQNLPQLPEEEKFERTTTHVREGHEEFSQTQSIF